MVVSALAGTIRYLLDQSLSWGFFYGVEEADRPPVAQLPERWKPGPGLDGGTAPGPRQAGVQIKTVAFHALNSLHLFPRPVKKSALPTPRSNHYGVNTEE